MLRYLHQLIELQQQAISQLASPAVAGFELADALGQLRRLVRPGSLVFIISDFQSLDQQALRHLQAIRLHNEVRICHITDPLERALPVSASGMAAADPAGAGFYPTDCCNNSINNNNCKPANS